MFKKILFFFCFGIAYAQAEHIVHVEHMRECKVTLEYSEQWKNLRLRAQHPEYIHCELSQLETRTVLENALPMLPVNAEFSSLSLGRLIDFKWISVFLVEAARKDAAWLNEQGRPANLALHTYVKKILASGNIVNLFNEVFSHRNYKVAKVNVEKVLISRKAGRGVPAWANGEDRLPYDAMFYIELVSSEE